MNSNNKVSASMNSNSKAQKPKNNKPKKKKEKNSSFWQVIKIILIVIIVMGLIGVGIFYFYVMNVIKDVEPIDPSRIEETLTENSIIVDDQGQVLEQVDDGSLRTIINYEDMSPTLINAFVAVEDKTFWEHNGFNFIRLVGAVKDTIFEGKRLGGTSTITQQLARNVYLEEIRDDRSVGRKIKEAYYALELEKYLTKEQIIEAYLNKISLGSSANGVEAAAQRYFSKSAKDLDLIESAMLAGVPKAPTTYSPMTNKKKVDVTDDDYIIDDSDPLYTLVFNEDSQDRYLLVLRLMHDNGYISDEEYEYAKNYDIKTKLHPGQNNEGQISSYFADMVKSDVINDLMEEYGYTYDEATNMLYTKGLVIHSTIDFDMQKTLESNYSINNFTTYYGESTVSAVKAFQRKYGLSADGIAGTTTLSKVSEVSGMDITLFEQKTYSKGVNLEEVATLKKSLYELGFLVNNENFPKVTVTLNSDGNIISSESRKILLYKKSNIVDEDLNLIIPTGDYQFDDQGNLVLLKNKRLNFYSHYEGDDLDYIQIVVSDTFSFDETVEGNSNTSAGTHNISGLFTYSGRDVLIPNEYKSFDGSNNVVVDKSFLSEYPDFFKLDGNNNLLVANNDYVIDETGIIQPQSAMVIIDYHTGELKAIVGGRNITGQKIYNRATNPRQPGSSIKPLSVFTPAIDSKQFTAATVIDDIPSYLNGSSSVRWPYNWYENSSSYSKYWGLVTLRESVQWSINVTAAKIVDQLGVDTSINYLDKFGITSVVKSGATSDLNLSSMALGGMTKGISPIEMTSAYGAIANKGVLNETITYTTVETRSGEILLQNNQEKTFVVDENVAYVVQDMMMTSVNSGVASAAKLSSGNDVIPVSGKTGTTSNKMDAWFIGYTPYYVGGVWFGNDINIPLDEGSKVAAQFWKVVMTDVLADYEPATFTRPEGIVTATIDTKSGKLPTELSSMDPRNTVRSEIFIPGTLPTTTDDVHVAGSICLESGKIATEYCPTTLVESRVFVKRIDTYIPEENLDSNGNPIYPADWTYELPSEVCDIHIDSINIDDVYNYTGYGDVIPTISFPDGSRIVQNPFYIVLTDGQRILLPVRTKILEDDTIVYPDGATIPSYMIDYIPVFDLDSYNNTSTPDINDALDAIDDNSNVTDEDLNISN